MAKTNERKYQSALLKTIREENFWHVTPIPDSGAMQRFGVEKVYDFILSRENYHCPIELKVVNGKNAWGWSINRLAEHQEYYLMDAHNKGLTAWVFIYHHGPLSEKRAKEYGVKQLKKLWAVPICAVVRARDEDGLATLSPEELDKYGYVVGRDEQFYTKDFIDVAIRNYERPINTNSRSTYQI